MRVKECVNDVCTRIDEVCWEEKGDVGRREEEGSRSEWE